MIHIKSAYMAIISSLLMNLSPLNAQEDPSMNFREKCRRTISGVYSDVLADLKMSKDAVTLAENFKKKSQVQLNASESKLKAINKKLETRNYAPELLNDRDALVSQIKVFHEQLMTSETQITESNAQLKKAMERENRLTKNIKSIFLVHMAEDPDGGPKPIYNKIEWKSPCPKYRALCPLPANEVDILRTITKDIEDIESSCHRYSNLK